MKNLTKVILARTDINFTRNLIDYVIETKMAGINWWSLAGDDFTGSACKQGRFSMIRTVNQMLKTQKGTGSSFKILIFKIESICT